MATFEDLRTAHKELKEGLVEDFNIANGGPVEKICIDGNRDVAAGDYGLVIILDRELTDQEKSDYPQEHTGVPITYIVPKAL